MCAPDPVYVLSDSPYKLHRRGTKVTLQPMARLDRRRRGQLGARRGAGRTQEQDAERLQAHRRGIRGRR